VPSGDSPASVGVNMGSVQHFHVVDGSRIGYAIRRFHAGDG